MSNVYGLADEGTQVAAIFERARSLSEEQLSQRSVVGALTVELARAVLHLEHSLENEAEKQARAVLNAVLSSHESQAFSVALTDRIYRSEDHQAAVSMFKELVSRADPSAGLSKWDQLLLTTANKLGEFAATFTHRQLRARVEYEARPFLLHAEPELLSIELEQRRAMFGAVNLNYLGEEVLGDAEATRRLHTYAQLAQRADIDALSIKLSGIDCHLDSLSIEQNVERLLHKLTAILAETKDHSAPPLIYFDMEAYRDLELTEAVMHRLLLAKPREQTWSPRQQFGLAVQAYLPESLGLIERLAQSSAYGVEQGRLPLRIRLVKGANLHTERVLASARGLSSPIFGSKLETDAHFKRCLRRLTEHARDGALSVGVASHNIFDLCYALILRENAAAHELLQLEMLEGMAGATGRAFRQVAGSVLIYAPAVEDKHLTSAISYLVRRLDENTEAGHFLADAASMVVGDAAFERQEQAFYDSFEDSWITPPRTHRKQTRREPSRTGRFSRKHEFYNAADTDWTRAENRSYLSEHFTQARNGVSVEPLLAESITDRDWIPNRGFDPSDPGYSYPLFLAKQTHIDQAIAAAAYAQASWSQLPLARRIELARKLAQRLEEGRGALLSAMALDAAKRPWEADIEISEAVDFARYYAFLAEEKPIGERPRGTVVVTPPWNFPLAIPLGGVIAALLAGNTVILKPAPETPWVACLAVQFCHEVGIPRDVLQFLPCDDQLASQLILDPRVSAVILTGATSTAQLFLKMRPRLHLMAETGGKNAAYLSAISDREQAIAHIVQSAFGHAGQKCSALSNLILHQEVFDDEQFKSQLLDATQSLVHGSAWDFSVDLTPLIHPPSGPLADILRDGERHGTWLLKPSVSKTQPHVLTPGILWNVKPGSFPQQTEFFGPILSVMRAEDFDHGMQLVNQSKYGLTAGLFSLLDSEHEQFVSVANAGNLYINRPTTGAVVGRQPFGGRKLSNFGPGAKAGGPDYLRQLVLPPTIEASHTFTAISKNYRRAVTQHFGALHDGTTVVGEHNYLRYQTANTMLVVGEGSNSLALACSLLARELSSNAHPIFILNSADLALTESLLHEAQVITGKRLHVPALMGSPAELFALALRLKVERFRLIGQTSDELFTLAANVPITVLSDPVSNDGMFELSHYFMSQSISHSFHRHGNLKLARLSKLRQKLEQECLVVTE